MKSGPNVDPFSSDIYSSVPEHVLDEYANAVWASERQSNERCKTCGQRLPKAGCGSLDAQR